MQNDRTRGGSINLPRYDNYQQSRTSSAYSRDSYESRGERRRERASREPRDDFGREDRGSRRSASRADERSRGGRRQRAAAEGQRRPGRTESPASSIAEAFEGLRESSLAPAIAFYEAHRVLTIVVVVLLASVLMLLGPTKRLYVAQRTGELLQIQYDDVHAKNETLTSDVERLQTREGIEDEARKRGYVSEGETALVVTGLPEEEGSDPSAAKPYEDDRSSLTKFLDALFGFDPEATWNRQYRREASTE